MRGSHACGPLLFPGTGRYLDGSTALTVTGTGPVGGSVTPPVTRGRGAMDTSGSANRVEPGIERKNDMALFMDAHTLEGGVSASDVASAHEADLATQGSFGVNYLRYWVDEAAGKIFCLVEAPDAEAAHTVHREAHGLVADEIYAVTEGT